MESVKKHLMTKENVVGAGMGEKWVDGKPTGEEAIVVFVHTKDTGFRKSSAEDLIPQKIDGVVTDVIEVGDIVKQEGYRNKIRPLRPGYSIGHGQITAGTIGGFFLDKDKKPVILSNNHVVANENKANIGDVIYQPGPDDSSDEIKFNGWNKPYSNLPYVGSLRKFTKLNRSGNTHDSGIVEIHQSILDSNLVDRVYPTINRKINGFKQAVVGTQVQKCGRTTGYTNGRIIATNAIFTITYDFGPAEFNKCIVTTAMSKGGDSGSIIFDMDMNAVGLLFAGSNKVTLSNDINDVVAEYGLSIWNDEIGPTINANDLNWSVLTTDGSLEFKDGVMTIKENANQYCFAEHALNKPLNMVACTINTGSDKGATWGPGITLQFRNGTMKINLRHDSSFGGYFNSNANISLGKTKPNTNYRMRIRKDRNVWIGEINDSGIWYTLVSIPRSIFDSDPVAIRLGKTSENGSASNYDNINEIGEIGECKISNIVINS